MQTGFWQDSKWGKVWVHRYGAGPRLLVALHGFGRDGRRFQDLGTAIGAEYTVLAPDLPFHGATRWAAERYDPLIWLSFLTELLDRPDTTGIHFLGHSLGGRIGLKLFDELQPRLDSFCLVAPDGLAGPYTRWIDRLPAPVVRALGRTLAYPEGLLTVAGRLHRWRLIDSLALQYLHYQLRDEVFRDRLRGTLRSVVDFRLRRAEVTRSLAKAEKEVKIFLGCGDRLVDTGQISRIFASFPSVGIELTDHGHELPIARLRDYYLGAGKG